MRNNGKFTIGDPQAQAARDVQKDVDILTKDLSLGLGTVSSLGNKSEWVFFKNIQRARQLSGVRQTLEG